MLELATCTLNRNANSQSSLRSFSPVVASNYCLRCFLKSYFELYLLVQGGFAGWRIDSATLLQELSSSITY